jgi:hypothetical protein
MCPYPIGAIYERIHSKGPQVPIRHRRRRSQGADQEATKSAPPIQSRRRRHTVPAACGRSIASPQTADTARSYSNSTSLPARQTPATDRTPKPPAKPSKRTSFGPLMGPSGRLCLKKSVSRPECLISRPVADAVGAAREIRRLAVLPPSPTPSTATSVITRMRIDAIAQAAEKAGWASRASRPLSSRLRSPGTLSSCSRAS